MKKIQQETLEWIAIGALYLALFLPVFNGLMIAWNTRPDSSHGWLILPIAIWMFWKRKSEFQGEPASPFKPALIFVVIGLLMAVVARRTSLESVDRFAVVFTFNAICLYSFGWRKYKTILFPLLFLFLLIPVPITITGSLTFPLQILASKLSVLTLSTIGIPVTRMGNILELPNCELEVAEACSGLRSLMAFVTLGVLLGWFSTTWKSRVSIFLLAIPMAFFSNVFRISVTAIIVYHGGSGAASGWIHELIGTGSFIVGVIIYALLAHWMGSKWTKA